MEKRKVRIYKAQDGGNTNSLLSDFMTRAQYGTQQQADPQQLLMQVATMIAPAELGGQGNDPNQVYMQLAQSYGEQAASQLLTAAVQYVQQMQGGSGNTEDVAQEESQSPELSVQEELIAAERERQRMQEEESFAQQDDEFMDELLYAKDGGSINRIKKKFVNSAVKLAKKQLGESVENQQTKADSTDIMDGRNKKSKDFLSGIQNNVTLSQVEKQAENLFQQQYGGFTDGILSKFVYGGDDEYMYGGLSKAQKGKTVTDQWGNTKTLTEEELADWEMQRQSNPNLRLTDVSFASESPSNLTDQQNAFLTAGNLNPNKNLSYPQYRFNPQPYSTDNFFDAIIPFNRGQYKTVYNMPKGMPYMPGMSDMSKYFTDSGITGFSTTKERLGPGARKWTFSPEYGQPEKKSADEMRQSKRGERQGPFSNFGEKLKYKFESRFGRPASEEKKVFANKKGFVQAQEGLQKFQGIDQGNQVNNQSSNDLPYLKPKSAREAMDSWYTGPQTPDPIQDKDWSVEAYQFKEFDPQQALNATFMGGNWLASQAERFDKGNRQALANVYRNQTADNVYPDTDYTQPGTYAVNRDFAFRGQKPGAPEGEGFQGIVREGGRIMAKGGTPYPQRFGSLAITATAMGGNDADQYTGVKDTEVRDSISKVPRYKANLEAEGGETAYGDINGDGFPEHYKITGPRHTEGGVPLNLPDGTFIFSDTRSMMIKECKILKMFNKPCDRKGYTPAELAKQYDINKYRKILEDNTTDKLEKKTAELMIKQYAIKLGALALAQESKKGFPQGIPEVARPYMEAMGLQDEDILPQEAMPEAEQQDVASEDQMMMESQEGMMASPEEMMRYGGMSFAQDGIIQRSTPEMQNYIDTMNKYYYRKGMDQEFLPSGQGPMNENQMYNWNELQENLSPSSIPQKNISSPEDILNRMQETTEDCPCMQERLVQGVPQRICVPCEEMPMAAYGMEMGGYDIPFAQGVSNYMKIGGQLDKYQVKGEVKKSPKVYTKDSLPEGAIIKTDKDAWNIQPGDFILQADGSYRKATGAGFNPNKVAVDTGTQQQTVQEFIAKDPIKNKELIDQANAIIEKGITDETIVCLNKNCSQIRITGEFNPDFKDRIILSRALNSNKDFSTDKYNVKKQSYTKGYEGKGAFVAGFTPEDYEKRYIFEKARGAGNTDEEAFAVVDQVYNDPKLKAKFRREYANMLGLSNVPSTDEDLLKPDFYKTRYKDVTTGIENVLSKDFARPAIGDDALSGFEHFDAFGFSPDVKYEFGSDELKNETVNTLDPQGNPIDINVPVPEYAPYWLQDELKTAGAFNRMYSREDQYPPSFAVDYEEPRGPFLDPAREIASREETTNKMLNYLSSFAGPQTYAANASKFAGDESRDVAEILSKYNDANVQLARQDEYAGVDIRNKEADARRKGAYDLVNQTNLMKAKKQNTKLADMKYLEDQVTSAITNRWKTDTLNKLYPQYSIDPSIGGRLYGTGVTKAPRPDKGTDLESLYQKYYDVTGDKDQATKLAMLDYNKSVSNSGSDMYPAEAIMAMYKQYGGDVPEAQTGMELMRRGLSSLSNLPKTLGSLNMLRGAGNLGNLARFTGSSPVDNFVTPIGSQTPIPLADLENLKSLSSFMPAENTFLESNYPVMQAGFLGDKAKGLIPQDFSDLGRSVGRLIRPLGSRVALPESGILDESNLTGLGMLDVTSLTDDQLADIIRKVDFTKPIAEMQKSLHPMELEALMANKDRVNALRTNLPKPKRKPKTDTTPKAESTSKTELDSLALELYQQPYKDLNDSQMMAVISESNWRKATEPVKKTRAKKTTTSTRKKATPKPATDNTEMMKEAKEKMAMDNYGEPYDSLSSLAKKMIDVEIAKLFGSSQPPFRDGGMYLTGSNVFPFTGY